MLFGEFEITFTCPCLPQESVQVERKKNLASHPRIGWHFQWKKLSWAWPFLYQSVCLFLFLAFVLVFSHPWTFTLPMTDIVFGTVMFGPKKWPSLRNTWGKSYRAILKNNLRQIGRCPSGKNENPENHSILQSKLIHFHPGLKVANCKGSDFAGSNVSCHLVPVLTGYLSRQVMYWQYRDNPKDYLGKNTFKITHQSSAHKKASVIQKL